MSEERSRGRIRENPREAREGSEGVRTAAITLSPRVRNRDARDAPIPRLAPVIKTVFGMVFFRE